LNPSSKLREARVARLATWGEDGPAVLPICFAVDGERIYTAIDAKPKGVPPEKLARVRRIRDHPEVALVVDEYSEDWNRLWYVLVRGRAQLLSDEPERLRALELLREKYRQYREGFLPDGAPVIRILVERMTSWSG
jgi:coenzyme F420-0:L-glutamate ligase/coenzyme F420-1:gamma-L-glutamate ligase